MFAKGGFRVPGRKIMKYFLIAESNIDRSVATFDNKGLHFQILDFKIFIIAAKAAKAQKLGVRDGLLGVVWVGGGKQDNCVSRSRLIRNGSRDRITINRNQNI